MAEQEGKRSLLYLAVLTPHEKTLNYTREPQPYMVYLALYVTCIVLAAGYAIYAM